MTHRRRNNSLRSEGGQAAVEFALVAPILIALLVAVVQAGITFNHYVTVTDAARAAARKAVTARVASLTPTDITQAATSAASDLKGTVGVSMTPPNPALATSGSTVTVTVTYPYSINILGLTVSSGNLTSTMTERVE
jgi:Flp pilus assembly protein TadG